MAVSDIDQLTEIQLVLQEDDLFSNGLWTLQEVITYFNQRQYRFLFETKVLAAHATIGWTPGEPEQPLPPDWIASIAALWHDLASGRYFPLPEADRFQTDHLFGPTAVATTGRPQAYLDADTTDTLTIAVAPAPAAPGAVDLLYVALSEPLDEDAVDCSGPGELFTVPDEFVPYLKYGVLADMLSKEGRGQDLLRARYCEQRFTEGITLAQTLLEGF